MKIHTQDYLRQKGRGLLRLRCIRLPAPEPQIQPNLHPENILDMGATGNTQLQSTVGVSPAAGGNVARLRYCRIRAGKS
jgi:hypothetical protein